MEYHLSIAGQQSGPHSKFSLITRIRAGELTRDVLCWRKGLTEWQPMGSLIDFEDCWPEEEESAPGNGDPAVATEPGLNKPRPWFRFWARMLDYMWFGGLVWMLLSVILPQEQLEWIMRMLLAGAPLNSMVFLLYVPLEAWLLSWRGTTPGRALMRIQVVRDDGGLPTFEQALWRSFQVFVKGVALLLPVANLFAMAWWRVRLMQKGATPWDESSRTVVVQGALEKWRYVVLAVVVAIMAFGMALSMALSKELMEQMQNLPK
ncbi:MAG: hypothetical protein RL693_1353 [Verrucomicrobiota bacterium]|jgi:uncharacterized RDD family membrane protein YckC